MRSPFAMAWAMAAVMGMGAAAVGQERGDGGAEKGAAAAEGGEKRAEFIAGKPELARVYVELERLVMKRAGTMPVETLRRVNVEMDNAANGFFTGNYSRAIRGMNAQIGAIEPTRDGAAAAFTVRFEPMVVQTSANTMVRGRVGLMYMPDGGISETMEFSIGPPHLESGMMGRVPEMDEKAHVRFGAGETGWKVFSFAGDGRGVVGGNPPAMPYSFSPYMWERRWRKVGEHAALAGIVYQVDASLDAWRTAVLARLDAVRVSHKELAPAIEACKWRLDAVSDRPSIEDTYLQAAPERLGALIASADNLVSGLEAGKDPFVGVRGDWWLALRVGEAMVPVRMYRDEEDDAEKARPLIIAVHGAGGDENLWMDGYGGGVLKDVAREKGAIVVSPRIVPGLFTPAMFDGIVEAVAKWQDVDRSRVYVIGHSMGGGVVTAWAKLRAEKIAAACSIAGVGSFTGAKKMAPMLAYAAELDGLIRPEGIRRSAEAGKAAGLDVEFREVANYGHVLVVGKVTREAVEWMMERTLKGEVGSGKAEGNGEK